MVARAVRVPRRRTRAESRELQPRGRGVRARGAVGAHALARARGGQTRRRRRVVRPMPTAASIPTDGETAA